MEIQWTGLGEAADKFCFPRKLMCKIKMGPSALSGPPDKAKLTTTSINNIFLSPTKRPQKIQLSAHAVPLSGVAQFKASLNTMVLLHSA